MISKIILSVAFALYCYSLFLPGIVFKPTIEDNKKNYVCELINFHKEMDNFYCTYKKSQIYQCPGSSVPGTKLTTREEITSWCGSDWKDPVSYILYGYNILLNPFAMFYLAWWPNVLFMISIFMIILRKRLIAIVVSILALPLALYAHNFNQMSRNEGGVNNFIVDHLASGYYLWILSIILLVVSALFVKKIIPNSVQEVSTANILTPQ